MKVLTLGINGAKESEIELPLVFSTPFRKDLISKSFTNLNSHKFQPQGRKPTAGMDVVARSNDPPTGQGRSRIAKMRGGGGGRQGEAGGVASVKGGRQAHPPKVQKVIFKKLNKKENKLALCSAIAATQSKEIIESRGHKIKSLKTFPIVISDEIESVTKTKEVLKILDSLQLMQDVDRLKSRRSRTGKSALRGRSTKIGKSILFVVSDSKKLSNACGSVPGVDVQTAKNLSVLDLAPGGAPIRLVVYSKNALKEIEKNKITSFRIIGECCMKVELANKIILHPYITEKTFELVETQKKICFIVEKTATKSAIKTAINTLYEQKVVTVNTARTVYGKKAFVEFQTVDVARDLATKIGML